ncbi:HipA domain-containing protein [Marinobacterium stanieri]|uniref:Serine/threonine-protein kinase HipA n=1 Tax=Marinobacterium stanieri TaxID=49186 RepID=A0A1N6XL11_9GAMM|nr:HipA domain-containing protein [Marinobacterium stanieri]SIR02931.1 serine/threonine-protein kinase HipA [Marinobacterium stanieri]
MAVENRTLAVWTNNTKVGTLIEHNNLWSFEYEPDWSGFSLSPALPVEAKRIVDGSSKRPVQWFFDNLLPEEGARALLAEDTGITVADAFGLLGHFGAESAGALTLLGPEELPGRGGKAKLSSEALSARIQKLPDIPLSQGSSKRMSLAGAQHKLPIIYEGGVLYEPHVSKPSTHILKPDHSKPDLYPHSAINEFAMMQLAGALGLKVPATSIIRVPDPVYLVERFDRFRMDSYTKRLHTVDTCQLLSIDRIFKYQECKLERLTEVVELTRIKLETRTRLFQWHVFNLLIGNTDDHLKNLSFFTSGGNIILAPHYDLLSTAVYETDNQWLNANLVWKIGDVTKLGQVSPKYLLELGRALGLPVKLQRRLQKQLMDNISPALDTVLEQVLKTHYPDGVTKDAEMRLLRLIRYGVIEDMKSLLS